MERRESNIMFSLEADEEDSRSIRVLVQPAMHRGSSTMFATPSLVEKQHPGVAPWHAPGFANLGTRDRVYKYTFTTTRDLWEFELALTAYRVVLDLSVSGLSCVHPKPKRFGRKGQSSHRSYVREIRVQVVKSTNDEQARVLLFFKPAYGKVRAPIHFRTLRRWQSFGGQWEGDRNAFLQARTTRGNCG
ncbi:hypothetical protein OQA88_4851 [Cercophora sp. LCS_1]